MQRDEEGCDGNDGEILKKPTSALIPTSSNNPRRYAHADSLGLQAFAFGCCFNICHSFSLGVKCVSVLEISVKKNAVYLAFYKQSCTVFSYGREEDVGSGMKLDELGLGCKLESRGDLKIKHYVQFALDGKRVTVRAEMLLITLDWVLTR